jgi:hypothetical protein
LNRSPGESEKDLNKLQKEEFLVDMGLEPNQSLSFIYSTMALQPFVGPWTLLQFRILFYTDGRTPWMSDQPVADQSVYTQQHLMLSI